MVKVYTTTLCPRCKIVKAILENNNINYETINLDEDETAKNEIYELGYSSVPIVQHEGSYYVDNAQIIQLINELNN